MTPRTGHPLALATAAALLGCAAPPPSGPPPVPLDAASVQAIYAAPHREDGVVLHGAHAGATWTKWVKPDGSLELSAAHGLFADTGRYVVRGDAVCSTWENIDGGRQSCVHLAKVGADEFVTYAADGTEGSRFRVSAP